MFDCDTMAWDSVIYKSKLLCGIINKRGMCTKIYFIVQKKLCKNFMVIRHFVKELLAKTVLRGHEIHSRLVYLEGKYTEWRNPQIRGENRQSGPTD